MLAIGGMTIMLAIGGVNFFLTGSVYPLLILKLSLPACLRACVYHSLYDVACVWNKIDCFPTSWADAAR